MASLREHTYQDYKLSCSFCRKDEDEVKRLIAGPDVYICEGYSFSNFCIVNVLAPISLAIFLIDSPFWRSSFTFNWAAVS